MERKTHSDAFCLYHSFYHWRNMPSGDVQRSSGGLPACPSSTLQLSTCQAMNTIGKKSQGVRKKNQQLMVMILYLISCLYFCLTES